MALCARVLIVAALCRAQGSAQGCHVELRSWSASDTPPVDGYIKVAGETVLTTRVANPAHHGVTIATICVSPPNCLLQSARTYDTHGSQADVDDLRDYLANMEDNPGVFVAVTAGDVHGLLPQAYPEFLDLGFDLSSMDGTQKFALYGMKPTSSKVNVTFAPGGSSPLDVNATFLGEYCKVQGGI